MIDYVQVEVVIQSNKEVYKLDQDLFIGRDDANNIVIPELNVSRHHAVIKVLPSGAVTITDFASNNGTFVNGRKINSVVVSEEDEIQVGSAVIRIIGTSGKTQVIKDKSMTVMEKGVDTDSKSLGWLVTGTSVPEKLQSEIVSKIKADIDPDSICFIARHPLLREFTYTRGNLKRIRISRTLIDRVIKERKALLIKDSAKLPTESVIAEHIVSAIAVPLICGEIVVAVVYVDSRSTEKQFSSKELSLLTEICSAASNALSSILTVESRSEKKVCEPAIIGNSKAIKDCIGQARVAGGNDFNVLVTGETGTGKELIARLVHSASNRSGHPFVAINCAAISSSIFESELFGYEEGAFTGATSTRIGKIEIAGKGTVCLDEIGEMLPELQAKLLRVLEQREFYRVGGVEPIKFEARVVCSTNRDLKEMIKEGAFREDLFYRISTFTINIPPLRERLEDIPLLCHYFCERIADQFNRRVLGIDKEVIDCFKRYRWPGNVRELKNVLERMIAVCNRDVLDETLIPAEIRSPSPDTDESLNLNDVERRTILKALQITNFKKQDALKLLGISWPTLNKKIKDYGLDK